MDARSDRVVLSVLLADRPGILQHISTALTGLGANIDGVSQTVVKNTFTVIMTASFDAPVELDAVRRRIEDQFRRGEASVVVRPFVEPPRRRQAGAVSPYILTIAGVDRTGILKHVTGFLAQRNINIEDWSVAFDGPRVTHFGEISVPDALDLRQLQADLRTHMAAVEMSCLLQHENLFRATHDVSRMSWDDEGGRHAGNP